MIEPAEQAMLLHVAASNEARDLGAILEFGTFLGRSTACLVNGASRWWTPERGAPAIYAYDSFSCAEGGDFAGYVVSFSRQAGVENFLTRADGRIDFRGVFDHYLGSAEKSGLMKTVATELRDIDWDGAPISVMHIDAPKNYNQLKFILQRFFPSLVRGSIVIFQDFFFQWSGTLIAGVQLLVDGGFIHMDRSFASSATARIVKVPTLQDMLDLDERMSTTSTTDLIVRATATARSMRIDRPEQFVGRLHLARMQCFWEQNDFRAAKKALLDVVADNGGRIPSPLMVDLVDMIGLGFNLHDDIDRLPEAS